MSQCLINATSWRSRRFRSRFQSLTATRVSGENFCGQQCVQDWRPQSSNILLTKLG